MSHKYVSSLGGKYLIVLRGDRQRLAGIRPLTGRRKVGVPGLKEALNEVPQVWGGADTGAAQALATQEREPHLPLLEPRARGGQPVEGNLGPLGSAAVPPGWCLMRARVLHTQRPAPVGVAGAERAPEVTKLQLSRALGALRKDLPRADLTGGKELAGALATRRKFLAFAQAWPQGQGRRPALPGLDVGLLIPTENATAPGRRPREVENLGPLLRKHRVSADQEVAQALGLAHPRGHNPLDGGRTQGHECASPGDPSRHIAHAVRRKAAKLPFLNAVAGDGDDRVPGQRGNKPVGAPRPGQLRQCPQACHRIAVRLCHKGRGLIPGKALAPLLPQVA